MFVDVSGDFAVGSQCGGEKESDFSLLEDITRAIAGSGLGAAIPEDLISENVAIEMRGLFGVADVEFYEIRSVDRKGVGYLFRCRKCRGSHDFSGFAR